jgi:DNA-binding NtrC family response regulator
MQNTILLVEDDEAIARMLVAAMGMWGYNALHASNHAEAVELAEAHGNTIGMAICDVLLPDKPGPMVVESLRRICPKLKTCFTSGYTLDILNERGLLRRDAVLNGSVLYLQKPFLPQALREVITRTMGEAKTMTQRAPERKVLCAATAC